MDDMLHNSNYDTRGDAAALRLYMQDGSTVGSYFTQIFTPEVYMFDYYTGSTTVGASTKFYWSVQATN